MQHLKGFGLENFRVFKDYTWFDFAQITILTGPNNSGKSSLIKALLLMKDNHEKGGFELSWKAFFNETLRFDNSIHGLAGGKTSKNEHSKSNILTFTFTVWNNVFRSPIFISYSYINEENITRRFSFIEVRDKYRNLVFRLNKESIYLDLPLILSQFPDDFLTWDDDKFDENWLNTVNKEDWDNGCYFGLFLRRFQNFILNNDIEEWDNEIVFESYYEQNPEYNSKYTGNEDLDFLFNKDADDAINELILNREYESIPFEDFKRELFSFFTNTIKYLFKKNGIDLNVNSGRWIESPIIDTDGKTLITDDGNFLKSLFGIIGVFPFEFDNESKLKTGIKDKFPNLNQIEYLPSVKGKIERSFQLYDNHILNIIIKKLKENPLSSVQEKFIRKWTSEFNIRNINIDINETLGISNITYDNKTLSDLGFGISQITAIILKIIISQNSILILEEPESNLHPNFQSKLADMLMDASQTFNIQFIVETHSEYIIRKLQYLVAKNKLKVKDSVIYYFNDPNNIPTGEPQVKKIEILEDGSLSDDFGSGFFDEAANWELELLRLKKNKIRQN